MDFACIYICLVKWRWPQTPSALPGTCTATRASEWSEYVWNTVLRFCWWVMCSHSNLGWLEESSHCSALSNSMIIIIKMINEDTLTSHSTPRGDQTQCGAASIWNVVVCLLSSFNGQGSNSSGKCNERERGRERLLPDLCIWLSVWLRYKFCPANKFWCDLSCRVDWRLCMDGLISVVVWSVEHSQWGLYCCYNGI